jgi:hypothetical protein
LPIWDSANAIATCQPLAGSPLSAALADAVVEVVRAVRDVGSATVVVGEAGSSADGPAVVVVLRLVGGLVVVLAEVGEEAVELSEVAVVVEVAAEVAEVNDVSVVEAVDGGTVVAAVVGAKMAVELDVGCGAADVPADVLVVDGTVVGAGASVVVVGAALTVVVTAASGTSRSVAEVVVVVVAGAVVVVSCPVPLEARTLGPARALGPPADGDRCAAITGVGFGSCLRLWRNAFSSSACTAACCLSTSATARARSPFTPASVRLSEDCSAEAAARSAASRRVAALTDAFCLDSSENTTLSLVSALR